VFEPGRTVYDMAVNPSTRVITVSVPPALAEDFDRLAEQEGRNRSELFREMLVVYKAYVETRTFESLQRYGAARATRGGIKTAEDVELLIRDARA
jgi:metal-responsive CopG/Arc/MetJ family transcriptional regulator